MKLRYLLLLSLLVLALPVAAHAQSEQDEPLTWEVVGGWDGRFRGGAWLPLDLIVSNSGPDVSGTLEFRLDGTGHAAYLLPIELPHNARKRVLLPVLSGLNDTGAIRGTLSLRAGGSELKRERVLMTALNSFGFFVGVVADDGAPLPELASLQGRGQVASLLRLRGAEFPTRPELLQNFDVLFVADADTESWTDGQRAALAAWLTEGNTLVVGGAPDVLRGLGDLLPADWEESDTHSSVAVLGEGTRFDPLPDAEPLSVLTLRPRPGSETLWQGDGVPLVVRGRHGLGTVLQAAFPLEQLNDAGDAAGFWQAPAQPLGDRPPAWLELRQRSFNTVQNALELPALNLPSILSFVGFLLLYIVVVGPLNYLLLRRLDRREWAYLTIPLVVLLFSGFAYLWGNLGRGSAAEVNELAIVRVEPGGERGQATSYLTVYSPLRGRYDLGVTGDVLVGDIDAWNGGGPRLDVRYDEGGVNLPQLLIDVGGVRGVTVEHAAAAPPLVVERTADGNVRLLNAGDAPVEDAALVRGDGMAQGVGRLLPGQERTVRFAPTGFVQALTASGSGPFDRQAVINGIGDALVLAGPGGFVAPAPGGVPIAPGAAPLEGPTALNRDGELMLIGWQARPTVEVGVNGGTAGVAGESLYIWPVPGEAR